MKRTGKISLSKLAHDCGVSLSTVYRVMRGEYKIGNPVHEQIRKTLLNSGHLAARISPVLLVYRNRRSAICHSSGDLLTDALFAEAGKRGIDLITSDLDALESTVQNCYPAGILVLNATPVKADIPVIHLNHYPQVPFRNAILKNQQQDLVNMLLHLKADGFKKIGFFYPYGDFCQQLFIRNFGLFDPRRTFETAEIPWRDEYVFCKTTVTANHFESCSACAAHFAGMKEPPDVLLFDNAVYLSAVISETRRLGVRMKFAATDSWNYDYAPFDFPVSELAALGKYPVGSMAEAAFDLLLEMIGRGGGSPRIIQFESAIKTYSKYADKKQIF